MTIKLSGKQKTRENFTTDCLLTCFSNKDNIYHFYDTFVGQCYWK